MELTQKAITPDYIIGIIVRWKWLIIIALCVSLTLGLIKTFISPMTYGASTTILVQSQRVPGSYVRSIVSIGINERIRTISQQIMSRSNLEKIIEQFDLFQSKGAEKIYLEDKIESLRKRIKVKSSGGRGGTDTFTISFKGSDPEKVMRIVNTLARYFMDENLKVREAQAIGTSDFLQSELEKTREKLEIVETRLSNYRKKYMGGLPDELESNLRTLDRLQQQLNDKQIALRDIKNNIHTLEMQSDNKIGFQGFDEQFEDFDFAEDTFIESDTEAKLTKAQKTLDNLLLRYTERHPDVVKTKKTIAKLKEIVEKEKLEADKVSQAEQDALSPDSALLNNTGNETDSAAIKFNPFEIQLNQAKKEKQSIEVDIADINKKMKLYQRRVEDTPKRELDLINLKRDYGNIKATYSSLLNRRLEAELSVNMEKKQKGEQFRIIDSAQFPEKPLSPNPVMILVFFLASGMGAAGVIIFIFEFFDTSIRGDEEIEKQLKLPILASISPLKKPGDDLKKRISFLLFILMTLYAAVFLLFFAVIHLKGINEVFNIIQGFV